MPASETECIVIPTPEERAIKISHADSVSTQHKVFRYVSFSGDDSMNEQGDMKRVDFLKQLAQFLNSFSEENSSNTPDFILATFIDDCLAAWNDATRAREIWYGVKLSPGQLSSGEYKYGNAAGLEAKLLPGEPWFALRAKDMYSIRGVEAYAKCCEDMGLVDHAAGVRKALQQMRDWQTANPDKVKAPD